MTTLYSGITHAANGTPPPDVRLSDIDLGSLEFWGWDDDRRDGAFATLRREAPIAFFEAATVPGFESGPGHWALTSYDHVHHASRHPEVFSSTPTSVSLSEIDPAIAEFSGSMINLDDPRHQRLRSIVNRAFTPKMVARIEESVRTRAQQLVSDLVANHPDGKADFVESLSGPFPLQVICDMMGIPEADQHKVFHWTSVALGVGDEEVAGHDQAIQAVLDLATYGVELAESRRAKPADDLTSNLVWAEVDGEQLSSAEIARDVVGRFRRRRGDRGRGDRALGHSGDLHAAQSQAGLRTRWCEDEGRRQGFDVVQLGQSRRNQVRRPMVVRRHPKSQPALWIRRWWSPLLSWRQSRSARDPRAVRGVAQPHPRYRRCRGARHPQLGVPPRHQATTGRLDSPGSLSCSSRWLDLQC
ncbi:Linalool 8-monooxygenase [uncultured Mycobacterium sp.]|uniref:Linalool 8-monooxygenase n=1 Tax=uncultured Mycobacterium sp. TaxID=171292 RepID=A0A1Y5NW52_9MYCO|nr:Linalool 8-monooxygenase [uncultured Mycobacterium sp.]